jgi:hypothetical protein
MPFPPSILFFSLENKTQINFLKSVGSEVMDRKWGEKRGELLTCPVATIRK